MNDFGTIENSGLLKNYYDDNKKSKEDNMTEIEKALQRRREKLTQTKLNLPEKEEG